MEKFYLFGTLCDGFSLYSREIGGKRPKLCISSTTGSLHSIYFFNGVLFIQYLQITKKIPNLEQWATGYGDLVILCSFVVEETHGSPEPMCLLFLN
eukprot:scaffold40962_cov17-Tisochrysis_lutea.AAC.2